jgi:hypothetical protein
MSITKKDSSSQPITYMIQSDLNNILPIILIALKLVEQQKIDIADESTSAPTTKTNKKENTNGNIQEAEREIDQDNASGQELKDLKE